MPATRQQEPDVIDMLRALEDESNAPRTHSLSRGPHRRLTVKRTVRAMNTSPTFCSDP